MRLVYYSQPKSIMADKQEKELQVPIRFRIPQKMPSVVANEMALKVSEDGVLLSFFELIEPIFATQPTEVELNLVQQQGIVAECVARVMIPKSKYLNFVKAINSVIPTPQKETVTKKKK